jgi:hypothetical protein
MVLIKNLTVREMLWKLPVRLFMDYVAVLSFCISGRFKDGFMIIKSHTYILTNFAGIVKKRNGITAKKQNRIGIYPKFLLFDYHIAGVRKFADLKF